MDDMYLCRDHIAGKAKAGVQDKKFEHAWGKKVFLEKKLFFENVSEFWTFNFITEC